VKTRDENGLKIAYSEVRKYGTAVIMGFGLEGVLPWEFCLHTTI